ncbi:hypothetical protein NUW54_g6880 [Trametes sanguinea]|uniref:Uncharacterized protein n=1 Tax=Trametes sanguinea TaxID=158606 RepID=A0ACC1PTS0_9APHY|nr:hypothetical protein NUW54_g6880 [Trametes sanguinea]
MNLEKYDLVLMDIVMPKLDGVSATSLIRQFDHMTPIISMTSNSKPAEIMKYYSSGMNDHLPKPFTQHGLWEVLEKHLTHLKVIQTLSRVPRSVGVPPLSDPSFDDALAVQASAAQQAAANGALPLGFSLGGDDDDGKINPLAGMGLTDEQYTLILQNLVNNESFTGVGGSLESIGGMGGLGLGADSAWIVRFLMAMFGWMTVLIGGGGAVCWTPNDSSRYRFMACTALGLIACTHLSSHLLRIVHSISRFLQISRNPVLTAHWHTHTHPGRYPRRHPCLRSRRAEDFVAHAYTLLMIPCAHRNPGWKLDGSDLWRIRIVHIAVGRWGLGRWYTREDGEGRRSTGASKVTWLAHAHNLDQAAFIVCLAETKNLFATMADILDAACAVLLQSPEAEKPKFVATISVSAPRTSTLGDAFLPAIFGEASLFAALRSVDREDFAYSFYWLPQRKVVDIMKPIGGQRDYIVNNFCNDLSYVDDAIRLTIHNAYEIIEEKPDNLIVILSKYHPTALPTDFQSLKYAIKRNIVRRSRRPPARASPRVENKLPDVSQNPQLPQIAEVPELSFLPPSFPSQLQTSTPPLNFKRHKPPPIAPCSPPPSSPLSVHSPDSFDPSHAQRRDVSMASSSQSPLSPVRRPMKRAHTPDSSAGDAMDVSLQSPRLKAPPPKKAREDPVLEQAPPSSGPQPVPPSTPPLPTSPVAAPVTPVSKGKGLGNAKGLPVPTTPDAHPLPTLTELLASSQPARRQASAT